MSRLWLITVIYIWIQLFPVIKNDYMLIKVVINHFFNYNMGYKQGASPIPVFCFAFFIALFSNRILSMAFQEK